MIMKSVFVFLLNNFIWNNKRGETKLYFLPMGQNKLFIKNQYSLLSSTVGTVNSLDLFSSTVNSLPREECSNAVLWPVKPSHLLPKNIK